jgi:hypothetical protein
MLFRSNDKPRWTHLVAFACLLGISFCVAPLPAEYGLSLGNHAGSYSAAAVPQKDSRLPSVLKAGLPFGSLPEGWLADWNFSFLKVDRKQNLRLWLVIADSITRSPPSI